MEENKNIERVDYSAVFKAISAKKKSYFWVLPIVFALSCLWIFPEPRYYICEVELAPENGGSSLGGLAGLVSSVGINIDGNESSDAIYPTLYPELFASTEFTVKLFNLKVSTYDGSVETDYYTYLTKHQKRNWLTTPFKLLVKEVAKLLSSDADNINKKDSAVDPFNLTKRESDIVEKIQKCVICNVDKKTDVITISVKDQDRKVCALLADSLKNRLQNFIIDYRTKKARQDVKYYQHLADSSRVIYEKAVAKLGSFNDAHRNVALDVYVEEGERLKNDVSLKLTSYNTFATQLEAAKAKVQERTPSFTTLKSATIPQKPAGPKRVIFIAVMLFLAIFATTIYNLKEIIKEKI